MINLLYSVNLFASGPFILIWHYSGYHLKIISTSTIHILLVATFLQPYALPGTITDQKYSHCILRVIISKVTKISYPGTRYTKNQISDMVDGI